MDGFLENQKFKRPIEGVFLIGASVGLRFTINYMI